MITIGICDDERQQRQLLRNIIEPAMELSGEAFGVREYQSGECLLAGIQTASDVPDILFLDIELGGASGVDVARAIRRYTKEMILIFVTGYADYVFNGYEVGALNYVLKPWQSEKIMSVVREALKRIQKETGQYFPIQVKNQLRKIPLADILYFTSDLRKTIVVTESNTWEYYGKLADAAQKLPPYFVRCHQRYLVNLQHVDTVEPWNLTLGDLEIPVSRKHYQETEGAFARYLLVQ